MPDVDSVLEEIIAREGGDKFTDFAEDKGGATRFGITLPALSAWLGRQATVDDLKNLTHKDAHELYRELYVQQPGFGFIGSQALLGLIVDCAVNHGTGNAVKMLQRAVGVKDDGVFGPVTKAAVAQADFNGLFRVLLAERIKFYGTILGNDYKRLVGLGVLKPEHRAQAKFARGWLNRAASFLESA